MFDWTSEEFYCEIRIDCILGGLSMSWVDFVSTLLQN